MLEFLWCCCSKVDDDSSEPLISQDRDGDRTINSSELALKDEASSIGINRSPERQNHALLAVASSPAYDDYMHEQEQKKANAGAGENYDAHDASVSNNSSALAEEAAYKQEYAQEEVTTLNKECDSLSMFLEALSDRTFEDTELETFLENNKKFLGDKKIIEPLMRQRDSYPRIQVFNKIKDEGGDTQKIFLKNLKKFLKTEFDRSEASNKNAYNTSVQKLYFLIKNMEYEFSQDEMKELIFFLGGIKTLDVAGTFRIIFENAPDDLLYQAVEISKGFPVTGQMFITSDEFLKYVDSSDRHQRLVLKLLETSANSYLSKSFLVFCLKSSHGNIFLDHLIENLDTSDPLLFLRNEQNSEQQNSKKTVFDILYKAIFNSHLNPEEKELAKNYFFKFLAKVESNITTMINEYSSNGGDDSEAIIITYLLDQKSRDTIIKTLGLEGSDAINAKTICSIIMEASAIAKECGIPDFAENEITHISMFTSYDHSSDGGSVISMGTRLTSTTQHNIRKQSSRTDEEEESNGPAGGGGAAERQVEESVAPDHIAHVVDTTEEGNILMGGSEDFGE